MEEKYKYSFTLFINNLLTNPECDTRIYISTNSPGILDAQNIGIK